MTRTPQGSRRAPRPARALRATAFWVVVAAIVTFFIYPFFWLISTSFKDYIDAFAMPPKIFFTPTLDNYAEVLGGANFLHYLLNSVISAIVPTTIAIVLGVPCAYAIATLKYRKAGSTAFFFLSTRIAPPLMTLLPLYVIFSNLGILGDRLPIIIMYTMICLPIVVWLMPVYFRDVPEELREAAILDGCDELGVFLKVVLPLVKGSIAATAIYCIIITWNEFLIALVMSSKASQTLPVTVTSFMTFQGTQWGPLSAAGTIIMIPMIVFGFFIQRYFARGIVAGAVKA